MVLIVQLLFHFILVLFSIGLQKQNKENQSLKKESVYKKKANV